MSEMIDLPPMPVVGSIEAVEPFVARVTWQAGRRAGRTDLVDLRPAVTANKFYRPLRDDRSLFGTVEVRDRGHAIGWGASTLELEMAATHVEHLAEETMTREDFRTFLKEHRLTHAQAAAALGRSRRQIENYLAQGKIPRVVALACFGYRARRGMAGPGEEPPPARATT